MKQHTLLSRSLNVYAVLSLLFGSTMAMQSSLTTAALSSQGSTIIHSAAPGEPMLQAADNVAPLLYEKADASIQLVLGILLIVLGFFLHGLSRMRSERPVHITVVPKHKRKNAWFWLEMRV